MYRHLSALLGLLIVSLGTVVSAATAPLRVGVEPLADQLSHADAAGQPEGYAVDIMRAVAQARGLEIQFVMKPWSALLEDFRSGQIDVLAAAVASPERESFIAFSTPHVDLQSGLFVGRKVAPPATHDEIGRLRLGTTEKSAGHEYMKRHGWTRITFYPRLHEVLKAIDAGECDGVIAVRLIANNFLRQSGLQGVKETGFNLDDMHYRMRFGVHRDAPQLLFELNEGLQQVRSDGSYERIYEKWIGPLEPRRVRLSDLKPFLAPALVLIAAVIAALIWQRRLVGKLARQAARLRENEERLRHVLDGSEDGFWDWNLETGKIERSERWASMLGYTLAEINPTLAAGTTLVHPDDIPAYELWQNRLNEGVNDRYDIEYRMKAKSGEWRWVLDRGKVVARAPDGNPLRMAGTHTDITERKRTEVALTESQAMVKRSAQLLEQTQALARIGGWEIDLGNGHVFWTRETYRLHEASPEEFAPDPKSVLQFFAPPVREQLANAIEETRRTGQPYSLDLELTTARGRRRRVHHTGAAELDGGKVVKIYGTIRDVTAEKDAEADREKIRLKMLEAQKLESLGVMAGGIAHDFNNLLTVILANATFVRSETRPDDPRLVHIESAARRAADLCRQMLAYAGKGSFVVEQTDLGLLVRDTAQLITSSISKKARLQLVLAENLPAVQVDVSQLRQVVMNLVINASEALGEHEGRITIATRLARPEPNPAGLTHTFDLPPGDCVCLEVSDTGSGMSPSTLPRIFDPFFTTKFAGRGLGLAAVLGIVRAHHGALTVESKPGTGSVFRLHLPAAVAATSGAPASNPATTTPRGGWGTVLIADDEPIVLATADSVLRHQGYRTVLAADGHEAVLRFKENPMGFSAVLLDLTMPGLDGAEVLRAIRAVNPGARVLIMSGFSEQDVLSRLRGLGDVPVLRKPFTREVLTSRLAEVAGLS